MADFELFIGYLGNGATVCNKAVQENGDYKMVAHISVAGNIKYYVKEDYIPEDAMEKIKATALSHREHIVERLDMGLADDYYYGRVLEECCDYTPYEMWHKLLEELKDKTRTQRNLIIKEYYLKNF